jgi:hypothetical protein
VAPKIMLIALPRFSVTRIKINRNGIISIRECHLQRAGFPA